MKKELLAVAGIGFSLLITGLHPKVDEASAAEKTKQTQLAKDQLGAEKVTLNDILDEETLQKYSSNK